MGRAGLRGAALPRSGLLRNLPGRGKYDCLRWPQLLIRLPSVQPAPQEEHSLPHSVSRPLFFTFGGVRWFGERSTPSTARSVRSAKRTTAAARLPLTVGAAASGHHPSWACPSFLPVLSPPPDPQAFASVPAVVYQHRPERSAASRNTHGDGAASPHPAVNTLPRAVCHHQSGAQSLPRLLPAQLSPLLGTRPSSSHASSVRLPTCTCVLTAQAHVRGPGQHRLCSQAWAVNLISCNCVTWDN